MFSRSTQLFLNLMRCYLCGKPLPVEQGPADELELSDVLLLAQQHQVLPIVFDAIGRAHPDLDDILVQQAWQNLRKSAMFTVAEQVQKRAVFARIYRSLCEKGLKALVIKGVIVAAIYPTPDCRISSDEDIFVRESEREACVAALLEAGMVAKDDGTEVNLFIDPVSGLHIEMHTALFPSYMARADKMNGWFADAFDRSITMTLGGTTYHTLSNTDHFLYLVCHAFKHFVHSGFGIRQLCDCMLYAVAYIADINWDEVWAKLKEIRADVFLANLRALSESQFGCDFYNPIADEYEGRIDPDDLLKDILEGGVYGQSKDERRQSSAITLQAMNDAADPKHNHKNKGSGRRAALFPSCTVLKGRYPYLQKAPFLLPIAWIHRLFSFLNKRRKGKAASPDVILETGRSRTKLLAKYGVIDE